MRSDQNLSCSSKIACQLPRPSYSFSSFWNFSQRFRRNLWSLTEWMMIFISRLLIFFVIDSQACPANNNLYNTYQLTSACILFEFMTEIWSDTSKLLLTAIWSGSALPKEFEQTASVEYSWIISQSSLRYNAQHRKSSPRYAAVDQMYIQNMQISSHWDWLSCAHALFLIKDQWRLKKSSQSMCTALVQWFVLQQREWSQPRAGSRLRENKHLYPSHLVIDIDN